MRFGALRARGMGPFREEIAIDFTKIEGPLVALCGENGAGKSTVLELLAGAMHRTCPTRGTLASLATARDSFLEVDVVNGASHRLRHVLDVVSGKGEASVIDANGCAVLESTKVSSFDKWAAKHLPAKEIFFASTFSAQKPGGFLTMSPTDRKGLLLRVLGIEHYEALAKKAREHVATAKNDVAVLDARLADEESRASSPELVRGELAALRAQIDDHAASVTRTRLALETAVADEQTFAIKSREAEELRRRIDDLDRRVRDATGKRAELERRITNNEGVLAQRAEIDAARVDAARLDVEVDDLGTRVADARAAEAKARSERVAARQSSCDAEALVEQAAHRRARIETRVADKRVVDEAVASIERLRLDVETAERELTTTETKLRETSDLMLHGATKRIEGLREGLSRICFGDDDVEEPALVARQTLDHDSEAEARATGAPAELDVLRTRLGEQKKVVTESARILASAEKTAARAAEIAAAETDLAKALAESTTLDANARAARERFDVAAHAAEEAMTALDAITAHHDAKKLARAKIDPLLKRVEPLAQADARLAELSPQLAGVVDELSKLETERSGLPTVAEPPKALDVERSRLMVDAAERALRGTEGAIAVKESQLTDAVAAEERIHGITAERTTALDTLADWTRLAEDLGRDGLQAMEIDAAGPRLTEIANQLLHDAFGPRFTIRFDLSRRSSDGKKDIEGLEVSVIDTEKGRDASAETLSGGEGVIISEAIALALTTVACARSGVERPTLVRDESGAALDVLRAPAYVRMLRRAAELIGADKVLLVSHSPAVWDLCDSRIQIADGRVQVGT